MGKIRVSDLARMMGIPEQDLVFKLRSIGVRIEGEDAGVDADILHAILQGKKLPSPREVIMDDAAPAPAPAQPGARRPLPTTVRRPPPNPLRPNRPRTLIQRVEPRIKTLPALERPAPAAATPPPAAPEREAAPAAPAPSGPPLTAAKVAAHPAPPPAPRPTTPEVKATSASAPAARESAGKLSARPAEESAKQKKVKRAGKKPTAEPEAVEELRALRGSLEEIEQVVDESVVPTAAVSGRRRRRAERRPEEASEEGGKVLAFRKESSVGPINVSEGMTVREFSEKLGVKVRDLIKMLFDRGILANINHVLEPELAKQLAEEFGLEARVLSFEEEIQLQQVEESATEVAGAAARAPVVTIMGHVDHGKTSLLDAIRSSRITETEFGGITQHIGAYEVETQGRKIVFLDTPGHEAFTMMRSRGARVTDIVILVVAADDGVMPQTTEAIDHARAAGVPIVVALNKVDKSNANPDRVKKQLAQHDLSPEDWGGKTVVVPISAIKKQGISELLEMILLTADLLELKASPDLPAQGVVLEARKEVGRGIVATVLVQNGALAVGDIFVAGATWGRVRAMANDRGERIQHAGPATPVEVTGFTDVPEAGDTFQVVAEEARARGIVEFRQLEQRKRDLAPTPGRVSLEQLFTQIEQGEVKELPVVLKADVQGSVEVLRESLQKLSTSKVRVSVLHAGVGAISTNDVLLASASRAIVVGFNIRPERNAAELAEKEQVDIRLHTVIYEVMDELRSAMAGLLEPTYREVAKGRAEVREIFRVPKVGTVAGCHVIEGVIPRAAAVRLLRDNRVIFEGKISSLKRFKDDASEVRSGFDCGIALDRFQDLKPGDSIEAFVREEVAPTL